ncbi:Predicted PurR-regulated permease PerM [Halobiforma haloterrestris]|uniref:Predicted PurR-regulated permease PerM n=1 Tax=Natronobacterium haloterrestre TaxID=148448 RepID=A0A1I1D157_NATHA|nr:AI-2E family transporter [Halobiforma haloterrestris]SFB68544.1 Predicted PurR-regulated permease PerM [Halobiforma haloterrestris]
MNLSRGYLIALVLVFAYLSWQLVTPFLQYVLAAILVAFMLSPLQRRLEQRVSDAVAAFALVAFALVALVVPFVVVVAVVAGDAADMFQQVDPENLGTSEIESRIEEELGITVDIAGTVADSAEQIGSILVERTAAWFSVFTHAMIGIGLALFLIYYLLRDGDRLLVWLHERTPLPDDVQTDLYDELERVTWAVLAGHVLIAVVQGMIAGLGLFATGIPNAAFWTFVMIVLSLIPLIGSFLVWAPAVGYLLITGEPVLAVGLAVYSTIIVGATDDYLRPIVVDRYAKISPAVIILGVLGGIYAFGIMGLFFGPVVVGALLAVLRVVDEHYDRLEGKTGTEY